MRQGVKFHDGADFNADAVIFNFERWRFTETLFHFENQVFGYYEYIWGGFDDNSIIASVEKVDDYTVKFTLTRPLASFLSNLAMEAFAISSPAAIQKYGEEYGASTAGCVGTGPFKFQEWVEGDHITALANVDYWGGKPSIDRITWKVIPDDLTRFLDLQAGKIHAMEPIGAENLAAAESDPNLSILIRPQLNTGYLAFHYRITELQDIRVREAIVHAIDRQSLVENFYGAYSQVAASFLPPSVWGYNEAIADWTYDPELSKKLLAEAGFPEGLSEVTIAENIEDAAGEIAYEAGEKAPLRLYYMPAASVGYPNPQEIGEAIAANLTQVGISVTLESASDFPTYLDMRDNSLLVGLYMLDWSSDNGDPDSFYGYFFGGLSSVDETKEPDPREGFYANQEVATRLYQATASSSPSEREALYKQVEQLLHDDVARLWIVHSNTPLLLSKKVSGYVPQPVGADYYAGVTLED